MKLRNHTLGILGLGLLVACGGESEIEVASAVEGAGISVTSFSSQAEAGVQAYSTNCATCHGASLEGSALGPILSGQAFLGSWGMQSPSDFYNYIKANMPPGENAAIRDDDYINIVAHVMRSSGVADSNPLLTASSDYPLATNIPGAVNLLAPPESAAPTGVILAGTVENFQPISDAMLTDPAPGDWPMLRRNYQAWSYSPLD